MTKKILIIEDSKIDQKRFSLLLREAAFDITYAESIEEGVKKLEEIKPDVVLLDYNLPDGQGIDLFDKCSICLDNFKIPVIFLTSQGDQKTAIEAMKRGALDYLNKNDVESTDLLKSIDRALERSDLKRQLEKKQKELAVERDKALQASQFKTEFLARMSHEIRNPLNSIIGMSDLLNANPSAEEQQKYIDVISHASKSLLSIINDVLDISKIEAGELKIEKVDFVLENVITEVYELMKVQADKKNLPLVLEGVVKRDFMIVGDFVRIKQILINFLSNAIKFTEKGKVTLAVNIEGKIIKFSVIDSGIGIPKSKLEQVFESYKQAEESTTRKFGGTGLGLAICKKLVKMMGGEIGIKSTISKGSEFFFTLPLVEGQKIKERKESEAPRSRVINIPQFKDVKILVADDNVLNRDIIEAFCKKMNCALDQAENGAEALEKIQKHNYNLVLMDMQMPVMDGKAAMTKLKELSYDSPVFALTGELLEDRSVKLSDYGFTGYIQKPIRVEQLADIIKNFVINKKK